MRIKLGKVSIFKYFISAGLETFSILKNILIARNYLATFEMFQHLVENDWGFLSVWHELEERTIFTATTEKCQLSSVLLVE